MNKFTELFNDYINAKNKFENYNANCIEVVMSLNTDYYDDIMSTRKLHYIMLNNIPNLISSSLMSDGGKDHLVLNAPRDEILEGLRFIYDFIDITYLLEDNCKLNLQVGTDLLQLINTINDDDAKKYNFNKIISK